MDEFDPELLGQILLNRGFKDFFLYMFNVCENRKFIREPIHEDLFETFQDIYDGKINRINICLPPRAGKSVMCKYFCIYVMTKNPKSQIIYTSYSQSLLGTIAENMAAIFEHPAYKKMFPNERYFKESFEQSPVNEFWKNIIQKETGKNVYTSKKITTYAGGIILFSSVGGQITGYGAGCRGAKEFSGMIIMDDPNKPADIHSQVMRDKCFQYFTETLLTRLNDSNVPIVNVQQRLHIEDLTGHLITKYHFQTLRKPLLDITGACQLPSQYTPERIKELQFDESAFSAQYQQEPIAERGLLFKRDWWKLYNKEQEPCTGQIIITADTAFKETKTADFSCIQVWELRRDKMLMREMIVERWEFPELIEHAKMVWNKWTDPNLKNQARYLFIEDKASGTPLQQTLSREGIEAIAWSPKEYEYPEDKVSRAKTFSWDVFCGKVYLPQGENTTEYLINECALFSEDMSHSHDDAEDAANMSHSIWKYYGGGQ